PPSGLAGRGSVVRRVYAERVWGAVPDPRCRSSCLRPLGLHLLAPRAGRVYHSGGRLGGRHRHSRDDGWRARPRPAPEVLDALPVVRSDGKRAWSRPRLPDRRGPTARETGSALGGRRTSRWCDTKALRLICYTLED